MRKITLKETIRLFSKTSKVNPLRNAQMLFLLLLVFIFAQCTTVHTEHLSPTVGKHAATQPEKIQIYYLERDVPLEIEKLGFLYLRSPLGMGRKKWEHKIRNKAASIGADGVLLLDKTVWGSDGEVEERYLAFRKTAK
jgi:hypothetical protein